MSTNESANFLYEITLNSAAEFCKGILEFEGVLPFNILYANCVVVGNADSFIDDEASAKIF